PDKAMMKMMKNPIVLVACALLFLSLAASQSSFSPHECCFKFISKALPKRNVMAYKNTDKLCPMQGVLFTMRSGSEICADPSMEWVKNIIEAREKVKAKVNKAEPRESE
uniref:C-C motif chemokine n=2 Tax=Anabas testudineus TaxID=64144 RepID=A0A3Q1IFC0_ANATE